MDLKKIFKKKMNILFGLICFFPIIMIISSMPSVFLFLIKNPSQEAKYYLTFIIPQILYPVLSALLMLIGTKIFGYSRPGLIKSKKVKVIDFVSALISFLFLSSILSTAISLLFKMLENVNIHIPEISAQLPDPETPFQTVMLFIAMAILPAFCEEFIYRATLNGNLEPISKNAAILFSSIAFGMMHATLEQIPVAFCMGLVLSYFAIKTRCFLLPVAAHFLNNAVACLYKIFQINLSSEAYLVFDTAINIFILLFGIISIIVFLKRNGLKFKAIKEPLTTKQALNAGISSISFWIFVALYAVMTLFNLAVAILSNL